MFGIGTPELILIIVLALLIIGPRDLPKVGRELGRIFKGLQNIISHVEADINKEVKSIGLEDNLKGSGNKKELEK